MAKKITFDPNASFMEEDQQQVTNADLSQVEYDPMDDGSMPYMPQDGNMYQSPQQAGVPIQKGYVDINNIENFSNPQGGHPNQPNPQYNQQMYEATQEPGLDYGQAAQNIEQMSGVTDLFNSVDQSTGGGAGSDTDLYAIGVAIKSLRDTIKVLKDVDYWIPQQHSQHSSQLKKIGTPIANALTVYVEKIEKMK